MKNPTTTERHERTITDYWNIDGVTLSGQPNRIPKIRLSVRHSKERKALTATLSYVEGEPRTGVFTIEVWQSDWPSVCLEIEPIARYSAKALDAFRAKVTERLTDGDYLHPTTDWAVRQINAVGVAA